MLSSSIREALPSSPENRKRGALSNLFDSLNISSTLKSSKSSQTSKRKLKPLPQTPVDTDGTVPEIIPPPMLVRPLIERDLDIKRVCLTNMNTTKGMEVFLSSFPLTVPGWDLVKARDPSGKQEMFFYNEELRRKLRGCCSDPKKIVRYEWLSNIAAVHCVTTISGSFKVRSTIHIYLYCMHKWMDVSLLPFY
jgi:hypothetical protein